MTSYISWLHGPPADIADIGGKAAPLGILARAGLPVPPGFVVTAAAFRHALPPLLPNISDQIAAAARDGDHALRFAAANALSQVLDTPLPSDLLHDIRAAYDELARQADDSLALAVRSSATDEDRPNASFAGVYDTLLNILDYEALIESIRHCWASLWSPLALSYRSAHGLDGIPSDMAVLVQRLVPATSAGVLFTRDHATTDDPLPLVTIQSAWGLGETVVQGATDADTLVVHPTHSRIESVTIGEKRTRILPAPGGGTQAAPVPDELQRAPSITNDQAFQLTDIAQRIEALLGPGQDIEWAILDGHISILQSRPIPQSPADPFPTDWAHPNDATVQWTLNTDSPPQSLTPLEQDLASLFMVARLAALQELPGNQDRFDYRYVNGFLYTRRIPEDMPQEAKARLRTSYIRKVYRLADEGKTLWGTELLPEIQGNLDRMRGIVFQDATIEELAEHLRHLLGIYHRHWTLHWLLGTRPLRRRWEQLYQELVGQPFDSRAEGLLLGQPSLTRETLSGIIGLARLAQAKPRVRSTIRSNPPPQALAILTGSDDGMGFVRALLDFLSDFGLRTGHGFGSTHSWRTPTWLEEPSQILEIIYPYLGTDLDQLDDRNRQLAARRDEAEAAALARIESQNDKERFVRELDLARRGAAVMEDHNFYIEQMTDGYLRLCLSEIGNRLVAESAIRQQDDIFFLTLEELRWLLGRASLPDALAAIASRRARWNATSQMTPPRFLGPRDALEESAIDSAEPNPAMLSGTAASPGIVKARARIVPIDQPIPVIESGEVLVAANAGPLWIPVFPSLAALVLDQGVLFQHAASIAREYGIPAVIQTGSATQVIRDGQMITVDGDNGVVYLDS